jgi:hypothetical protein
MKAFVAAARLHGRFLLDSALLDKEYLRAADWVHGTGKEGFLRVANFAIEAWKRVCAKHLPSGEAGEAVVRIDDRIVRFMRNAIDKIDFEEYAAMWRRPLPEGKLDDTAGKKKLWTMVHGDFHPANFMVVDPHHRDTDFSLTLLDWEACGVGCGPQDLGQFIISHCTAEMWRSFASEAIAAYRSTLMDVLTQLRGADLAEQLCPSLECIHADHIEGGLCRWAWLLPVCMEVCPPAAAQYFHDQVLSFMLDHGVDPESLGMMRP